MPTNYTAMIALVATVASLLDTISDTLGHASSRVSLTSDRFGDRVEVDLYGAEGYLFVSHGADPERWYGDSQQQATIIRQIAGAEWTAHVTAPEWAEYKRANP
jgi:hypothetical protein